MDPLRPSGARVWAAPAGYSPNGVKRAVICAEIAVLEFPVTSWLSHTFRENVFVPAEDSLTVPGSFV